MTPDSCDLRQVEAELLLGLQQLEALSVGLHQPVLHGIVHHLDEVARACLPHVTMAPVLAGSEGAEYGFQSRIDFGIPAHHEAVPLG